MSIVNPFDIDAATSTREKDVIPPIWAIDLDNDNTVYEYSKKVFELVKEASEARIARQRENIARYRGYYLTKEPEVGSRNRRESGTTKPRWPRININHSRDLVDQKVSKTTKIHANTEIVPDSNEFTDKQSSKVAKRLTESVKHANEIRDLHVRLCRRAVVTGESWLFHEWDKKRGPISSKFSTARVEPADHEAKTVEIHEREGDITLRLLDHDKVFIIPGPSESFRDAPGQIIIEHRNVEELRALYPDVASFINPEKELQGFDYGTFEDKPLPGCTTVAHFYYRSSEYLPDGLYFSVCEGTLLEPVQKNPIPLTRALEGTESGNLPACRLTDIDLESCMHGWSSMEDINVMQVQYDKLTSLILRNIFLFCHPKWMVPRGGCNMEQLGNGTFVMQYSSATPPQLATYQAVTQEMFTMWKELPPLMGKFMSVYEHSRGDAPQGTRSASQLLIYDEQEEEHRAVFRKKLERMACESDAKILALMGEYYDSKRVAAVLGEDQKWISQSFKVEDLKKDYVVRVKPTNALPDNKYARIRTLAELKQMAPTAITDELFMDMLELGQHEKFIDYKRTAVMAAEAENELMLEDKDVEEPAMFEDLINHWLVHAKLIQSREYKTLPKNIRKRFVDHILVTEALMFQQGNQNPVFKQQVMQLSLFPLFYIMPATPGVPMPMGMPGQPSPQQGASQTQSQPPNMMVGEAHQAGAAANEPPVM